MEKFQNQKLKKKSYENKNKSILNSRTLNFDDEKISNVKIKLQTLKNEDFETLNLPKNKDLIPGQYEGGIKIWECSLDLCSFLPNYIGWYDLKDLRVLEIGCGHGLPGLYFLLRESYVLFQDFNKEILEKITLDYIIQINNGYKLDLTKNSAFIDGDWKDLTSRLNNLDFFTYGNGNKESFFKENNSKKFDIIVSADTLYNVENYDSLYKNIISNLNNPGICFISSKKYYFGVGGGTSQFIDYVTQKNELDISCVHEINDGMSNIRQILELRHKK